MWTIELLCINLVVVYGRKLLLYGYIRFAGFESCDTVVMVDPDAQQGQQTI